MKRLLLVVFLSLIVGAGTTLTLVTIRGGQHDTATSEVVSVPSAFGGAITTGKEAWLLGGWDEAGMHSAVFRLSQCGEVVEWISAKSPWHRRSYFPVGKVGEKVFIAGGFDLLPPSNVLGDVWASPDMVSWEQVAIDPAWEQREAHGMVEHEGSLFLIGGVTYFRPDKSGQLGSANPSHLRLFSDVWKRRWVRMEFA